MRGFWVAGRWGDAKSHEDIMYSAGETKLGGRFGCFVVGSMMREAPSAVNAIILRIMFHHCAKWRGFSFDAYVILRVPGRR